jgi:leucyl/phenylalanyl-tRNA--protein transferase
MEGYESPNRQKGGRPPRRPSVKKLAGAAKPQAEAARAARKIANISDPIGNRRGPFLAIREPFVSYSFTCGRHSPFMLAQQSALSEPAAPDRTEAVRNNQQLLVSTGLPEREPPLAVAKRWVFGTAYALQPQWISKLPSLLLWTAVDFMRGGTIIPAQNRTKSRPDTFGGVVRDLTPESFLAALRLGFFPWAHCGPLKWWTRSKRAVLFFPELHVSRRLKRLMASGRYRVAFDTAFDEVLLRCAAPRAYNWHSLTWLTPRFMQLFSDLHRQGHAHSFEVRDADGKLVGGGFGVAVGRVFVGESMFSLEADASKVAAAALYSHLEKWGFALVDARDMTPVLEKSGYREISRSEYEQLLRENAYAPGRPGPWTVEADAFTAR